MSEDVLKSIEWTDERRKQWEESGLDLNIAACVIELAPGEKLTWERLDQFRRDHEVEVRRKKAV